MKTLTPIDPAEIDDASLLLALNRANEAELSPLSAADLRALVETSFLALTTPDRAAFLIAFDQDAPYASPNFLWFKARYPSFAYVDRIAVSAQARGRGVARALYEALFEAARAAGRDAVVCEVNADPPNPASDAFHAALGFAPVGEARLEDRGKTVRYFRRPL
ncbi:MAG: GNAT family N-acetyltransferase [Pseudomonadota bacterium]